jgi:sugar lactone lactonase YvrE
MDYGSHSELAEVNANTGILTFLSADGLPTAGTAFSGANVYCSSGTVTGSGPLTLDKYGDGCPAPQSFTSNAVGNIGIDPSGNIYYADNGDGLIRKLSFNNSFPATTVGSPAPTQNLVFVLFTGNTGDTVTSSTMADSVTTQGITAGSEFTNAVTGDSCGGTTTLAVFLSGSTNVANDVCIIPVTFTPMYAGMRSGAVQISGTINSVSTLLGTVYLNGAGNGAELAIDPGTTSTLGSKNQTSGVATDSAGNVYVDYFASKSIYRIPSGGGTPVKIASLSDFPCQIAVDGAGNLYVAVISGNIYEFAGASTSAGLITETPIVSGLSSDTQGVAVDASGNLYIADTYNNRVLMQPVGNGEQMVLGSGFSLPVSVAVDASGNVYVADSSLKEVEKLTIVNGAVVQQAAVTLLSGAHPASVAVDAAGDIYYGDYNTGQIVEVPVSGTTEVVASGFTYPANIALDPSGNLYVADSQSNSGISEFARTAASQTLASGTPQIATITEIGNVNYTGSTSQTDSVDFSVVGTSGSCSTTAQFTLDFGATCELTSSLLGGGSVSDTVSFTGSTSTLNLSPAVGTTTTLGTVTSTSSSPTYGDTITVTVTVAANSGSTTPSGTVSFVVDSGLSSAPFTLTSGSYVYTLSTPASPLSAGAHTIAATYNPGTGSLFAGSSGTLSPSLTVLPMAVTVAPSPVTITYGQSSPITISSIAGTSGNIVGLLPLDSSDTAKFSTLATTTSPVSGSPYAITGSLYTSGGGVDSNYTVSVSSSSTVTIQPAALTLVINNASMSTGQSSLPTFTGTLSGYLPADANYVAPVYSTTATVSSPVGQYTITATGLQAGSSGDRSSDYTLPLANITTGTLTISSSVVSEVVTVTSTTTVSYGQAVPAITGTFNPALPAGITATFSSSASAGSPVGGSYPITVQFFGTGSGNYQSTFAGGSATAITIQPAAVNVVVNSTSKSYGAINPNFTGTLSGTYGTDATNGNIAVIYSTTATQSSPVNGSTGYLITATGLTLSGSAAGNYTLGTVTPGTLTINPATVTGSVNSTSKTYGAVNPTFTGSFIGILPADSANVTVNYSTTATQFSPVNGVTGYPITAISLTLTGSATGNYSLGTVTAGTLTINPITVSGAVNSTSRSYGANNPAFTSTLNGIFPADSTNVIPLYSTTATQTSPVNGATGYPITMTGLSGSAASNYTLGTVTSGTLTILPAIVNVTATSTSRGYGAANPAFTGTFSNVIAQDLANVTANFSTTATANSPVSGSPYPITASALILTGSATGNYTLGTVTAGNLTIAPAAVSVSVNSTSRAYGAANPSFTSTLGGVLVADTANVTPIYSTAATQTSPVSGSPYAITVTGLTLTGSATGNYTLGTVTTGNLTINPIAAGVSVNSATRQYGLANPTLSGTLSNVLSQDAGNVSAVYSTTATLTSPVSTYPITANSLTGPAAGNYTLGTVSNGVLTITPATTITGLTASAPSVGIDSQVTFTATVTSASAGTPSGSVIFSSGTTTLCTEALAGGQVQCSTSSLPAGSPVITATYGGSTNFAGSTSAGLTEIVATPGVTGTPSTSSITIKSGSSGTVTLNLTAVNYIGTATYSCALLPPGMTCSFNPASATFTSTNATATTVLTISTNGASGASGQFVSQQGPGRASPASIISAAGLWLPCAFAGFFGLAKWRRPMLRRMMLLVVLAAGLAGLAAVSGCGGSSGTRQTTPGTYNIQVVITAGTVQVIPLTVIVQ